jgi:hypothetical protein
MAEKRNAYRVIDGKARKKQMPRCRREDNQEVCVQQVAFFLVFLFFDPEDSCYTSLRNVDRLSTDNTTLRPR